MVKYVNAKMTFPFGNDAMIDIFIQIDGNQEELTKLKNILNDEIQFGYIYSEKEIDGFMAFHDQDSYYTGSADNMELVKLSGKLFVPDIAEDESIENWWEDIVKYSKWPDFTKLAENVQLLSEKSDRQKYEDQS